MELTRGSLFLDEAAGMRWLARCGDALTGWESFLGPGPQVIRCRCR